MRAAICFLLLISLACENQDSEVTDHRLESRPDATPLRLGETNVLWLTLCTLRADRLQAYGYPLPTSETIAELAESGVVFENAITVAPWTRPSIAAQLTGQHPRTFGFGVNLRGPLPEQAHVENEWYSRKLHPTFETAAEIFRKAGYLTIGLTANPNNGRIFGFEQGYDLFFGPGERRWGGQNRRWGTGYERNKIGASELHDQFEKALRKSTSRPFFAHITYVDVHLPLGIKAGIPLPGNPFRASETRRYDRMVYRLDQEIGHLLERMSDTKNLLIVITADHGEGFEPGRIGHGLHMFDQQVRIPFLLHHPGLHPRRVPGGMSSIDVLPTLLSLLGGPPAGSSFAGTSQHLAALGQAPVKESEFIPIESDHHGEYRAALLTRHWKLMEWLTVDGSVLKSKLFSRIEDPAEQEDLAPTQRALVHNLHKKLVSWQARTPTALWIDDHTAQIDDDLRESLRALGYVEEDAGKHMPE